MIGGSDNRAQAERSIKDLSRWCLLQSGFEMRVAITLTLTVLFAGSALAAPQFEGVKNLFSSLANSGGAQDEDSGTEKVPYTTLKQFDVSATDDGN